MKQLKSVNNIKHQQMMKKLSITALSLFFLLLVSCNSPQWMASEAIGTKIALDSKAEPLADTGFQEMLQPFKQQLDVQMNEVIGHAETDMRAHKPESLLSNWSADVYRVAASEYLGQQVDVAIVNLGGLRTHITAGPIRVRKVYELMPFENELVILWLRGEDIEELLHYFARIGGQGVGGIRMVIKEDKATAVEIAGEPLDRNRVYTVATNDYLAEGNDYMPQLTRHSKRINTRILVRDMFMNYILKENEAGRTINAALEGRIIHHEE